jgi:hypothetical protein
MGKSVSVLNANGHNLPPPIDRWTANPVVSFLINNSIFGQHCALTKRIGERSVWLAKCIDLNRETLTGDKRRLIVADNGLSRILPSKRSL